jgi:hypothetical protein
MNPLRPRNLGSMPPVPPGWPKASPKQEQPQEQFRSFNASALYCPKCREATPVRERLLLVLPDGELYEYRCARCGTSTGSKTEKNQKDIRLIY